MLIKFEVRQCEQGDFHARIIEARQGDEAALTPQAVEAFEGRGDSPLHALYMAVGNAYVTEVCGKAMPPAPKSPTLDELKAYKEALYSEAVKLGVGKVARGITSGLAEDERFTAEADRGDLKITAYNAVSIRWKDRLVYSEFDRLFVPGVWLAELNILSAEANAARAKREADRVEAERVRLLDELGLGTGG